MQKQLPVSVKLANPRGFCAGVDRAIAIVNQILKIYGPPIYVKHEIVHNQVVVTDFEQRGVIFIEDPKLIPQGAILVYSAHGVSAAIEQVAKERDLKVYNATCPLVTKVHAEVKKLHAADYEIIMIGHAGHPEVEGTLGQVSGGTYLIEKESDIDQLTVKYPDRLAYITQTTLSIDDTEKLITRLKQRFPRIVAPAKSDICYATQNRQEAVKRLASECQVVLVVGSSTSSNSNRLCEVARCQGIEAHLINTAADIKAQWLENRYHIGVTAGASAPEHVVQEVVTRLRRYYPHLKVKEVSGVEENIIFSVPKQLMQQDNIAHGR